MQLRYRVLKLGESLVHHVALLEDHLGELVFLSVDPEIGEGLLCRVQDLNQIVQGRGYRIIVENPISRRKVLAVVAGGAFEERESEEILKALEVLATSLQSGLRIKVVQDLILINLLHRVLLVLIPLYQLTASFGHPLDRIKDKACRELHYVSPLIRLFLQFDLFGTWGDHLTMVVILRHHHL